MPTSPASSTPSPGNIPPADPPTTWRAQAPGIATEAFRGSAPVEDPAEFGPDGRLNPRVVVAASQKIVAEFLTASLATSTTR